MRYRSIILFLAVCAPCFLVSCDKDDDEPYRDVIVDFQDITFSGDVKYNNNAGEASAFVHDIVSFPNHYEVNQWGIYWCGFAYSQMHDRTTFDLKQNEFSVYVNENNDNKFALVFVSDPNDYSTKTHITFSQPVRNISFDVANSTYAALVMKNGYSPFGTEPFEAGDYFTLLVQFYDANNNPLFLDEKDKPAPKEIPLAEGTDILDQWLRFETTGDVDVSKIEFTMQSSDTGSSGINTPTYFCLDNLKARTLK